eukprot:NODE_633_length_2877_cov_6.358545.p1 GENE.NODE_633_length_2877_cov_6.358545~~NODE_633_length_2877_cov_6.358545.p1  ORF type:complete len:872 (+),score=306.55 NODE_633_length_2877_cov_6.358545:242-2617(+)
MLIGYGVKRIYGIRNGFTGLLDRESWMPIGTETVVDIHNKGGTILASDQGNPTNDTMAQILMDNGVRQLICVGGDGTQNAVVGICQEVMKIGHNCAVVGVPKTVDNDLPMMDKTFGFDTAVTEACASVDAAYVEASCNSSAISLVKMIGRSSGMLALNVALASRTVDLCLLPEMVLSLEKVLDYCGKVVCKKGYMVVVVAEGCSSSFADISDGEDIGEWLKEKLEEYFAKRGSTSVKYIDATQMVRYVKANANDSIYCSVLAQHAVHAAMAGYTGITIAKAYNHYVYVPAVLIAAAQKKSLIMHGRWMHRLKISTQQPMMGPDVPPPPSARKGCDKPAALKNCSTPVGIGSLLREGDRVKRLTCMNLGEKFQSKRVRNPLEGKVIDTTLLSTGETWSLQVLQRRNTRDDAPNTYLQFARSGACEILHFDPLEPGATAAIVTCGGICPGLNSVIRELVKTLHMYGVQTVYGIIGGFKGVVQDDRWIVLTDEVVQNIHLQGGSILVSDRGNPPHSQCAEVLRRRKVRQYFVLGGDGSHQGAMESFEAMLAINHECAVVGVPKTIDNDIQLIDSTFGFDTACTEAEKAIDSANVEATTNANSVGLVKLMGRSCGFIACCGTIAARHVDVCLIPEMSIDKDKLLDYIASLLKAKSHVVVVVAEGCDEQLMSNTATGTDAGGNRLIADAGLFLKAEIVAHCKKISQPCTIKYIDPTYMIRSVPANAFDSVYCSLLAQQAVHIAMAGYTGVTVGKVDERYVMLPIHAITRCGPRKVDVQSRLFERLIATTHQPSFAA